MYKRQQCNSPVNNGILSISNICVAGHDLAIPSGPVFYVMASTASEPAHTGFSYDAPFLTYLIAKVFKTQSNNQNEPSFILDVTKPLLQFLNIPTFKYVVPWKTVSSHGGRSITVSSIHGDTGSAEGPFPFTIDTGDYYFLRYDSSSNNQLTSELFNSKNLAFTIPLSNGQKGSITITFKNNHRCNNKIPIFNEAETYLNTPQPYTHNVFALGFLSNFLMGFYDSVYATPANGNIFFKVQPEVSANVSITTNSITNAPSMGTESFTDLLAATPNLHLPAPLDMEQQYLTKKSKYNFSPSLFE